jgi:hypothetical protein
LGHLQQITTIIGESDAVLHLAQRELRQVIMSGVWAEITSSTPFVWHGFEHLLTEQNHIHAGLKGLWVIDQPLEDLSSIQHKLGIGVKDGLLVVKTRPNDVALAYLQEVSSHILVTDAAALKRLDGWSAGCNAHDFDNTYLSAHRGGAWQIERLNLPRAIGQVLN